MIWKRAVTLQALNAMGEGNMVGLLDIQFTRIGDDDIEATMPVDHRVSLYRRGAEGGRTRGEC